MVDVRKIQVKTGVVGEVAIFILLLSCFVSMLHVPSSCPCKVRAWLDNIDNSKCMLAWKEMQKAIILLEQCEKFSLTCSNCSRHC